jgi:hypothetical protein
MSAMAAAFAESGHGSLTGMSTRPRSPAGDPMTLGNMRANDVRSFDVSCWQCHHRTILSADPWPDHVPVPAFGTCAARLRELDHSAGFPQRVPTRHLLRRPARARLVGHDLVQKSVQGYALDPRGKEVKVQGVSVLPTRNPRPLPRLSEEFPLRSAERRSRGPLPQEPPRRTRLLQSPLVHAKPSVDAPL